MPPYTHTAPVPSLLPDDHPVPSLLPARCTQDALQMRNDVKCIMVCSIHKSSISLSLTAVNIVMLFLSLCSVQSVCHSERVSQFLNSSLHSLSTLSLYCLHLRPQIAARHATAAAAVASLIQPEVPPGMQTSVIAGDRELNSESIFFEFLCFESTWKTINVRHPLASHRRFDKACCVQESTIYSQYN
jgi:hypothetical protein